MPGGSLRREECRNGVITVEAVADIFPEVENVPAGSPTKEWLWLPGETLMRPWWDSGSNNTLYSFLFHMITGHVAPNRLGQPRATSRTTTTRFQANIYTLLEYQNQIASLEVAFMSKIFFSESRAKVANVLYIHDTRVVKIDKETDQTQCDHVNHICLLSL